MFSLCREKSNGALTFTETETYMETKTETDKVGVAPNNIGSGICLWDSVSMQYKHLHTKLLFSVSVSVSVNAP